MTKDTTINIRIDAKTKKKAAKVFEKSGYTLSSAVQIFLTHVAHEGIIPFEYRDRPETISKNDFQELDKKYGSFQELIDEIKAEIKAENENIVNSKSRRNARS